MAVGIAVAIVVATRLQVFRQATAERVRGFAAVGVYIELEGYFVTPWQFLVPGDVVVYLFRLLLCVRLIRLLCHVESLLSEERLPLL